MGKEDVMIQNYLDKYRLRRSDFAKMLGVNRAYITKILKDESKIGFVMAVKINNVTKGELSFYKLMKLDEKLTMELNEI